MVTNLKEKMEKPNKWKRKKEQQLIAVLRHGWFYFP
jgi:hypothetical protein